MDYREFYAEAQSVVDSISETNPAEDFSDCTHLLDYGESQEAIDVLVAKLVRFNVPISKPQRERLRSLISEFDFTEDFKSTYRYLSDSEMLDRMIVVDESAS